MFERFQERAIKAVICAQEETKRLGHSHVGTEQLLTGLILAGGRAADTLTHFGICLNDVRNEIEKIIGHGIGFVLVEIPFTPRCKSALIASCDAADSMSCRYVGTEHLLLGLLSTEGGVATRVLEGLGVSLAELEAALSNPSFTPNLADVITEHKQQELVFLRSKLQDWESCALQAKRMNDEVLLANVQRQIKRVTDVLFALEGELQ